MSDWSSDVCSSDLQQREGDEADADPGLHAEHPCPEAGRQVAPEGGNGRAEEREDEDPQQHRSLVVAPHAGDLVEQRLELGRASCGDSVCQYMIISVVSAALQKTIRLINNSR